MATTTRQSQEQRGQDVDRAISTSTGSDVQTSNQTSIATDGERIDLNEQESTQQEGIGEQRQIQRSHADITLSFKMKINLDPSRRY